MEKKNKRRNIAILILKWTSGLIVALLIFMFAVPNIFNDFISREIKKGINENLKTELQFKTSDISFFRHFPALTFSFEEIDLAGSEPFSDEPLVTARELGFGINVFKLLFSKEIELDETYLTDCNIKITKDRFGRNNYDVYQNLDSPSVEKDTSSLGLNFNLDKLKIKNANVHYQDGKNGITIISNGLNYKGKGGLDEGILELGSRLEIDSIDVVFDKVEYLKGKKLRAKSFTIYDTKTLSIELDDNTISLNDLSINFNGKLDVFDGGLSYDLIFNTKNGNIRKLASVLPPQYKEWSKEMDLKGKIDAAFYLIGYSGTVPDSLKSNRTAIEVDIYNGHIAHKDADRALENLFLKFKGSLEDGWLDFRLDSLKFKLNDELTSGKMVIQGRTDSLHLRSDIQSELDLTALNQTLQLPNIQFNGILSSNWNVDGVYQPSASRFPKTKGHFKLNNGYIQTTGHPEPIKNIELDAVVRNDGHTYSESSLMINVLNFSFLENEFKAKAFFKDFDQPEYQINCVGSIDFTSLHQVINLPFLISNGSITADLDLQGQLTDPDSEHPKNGTPTLHTGTLEVKNIQIATDFLPQPMLVSEGKFLFLNEKMAFSKLDVHHGTAQVAMNGFFQNYLDYMLLSKGILRGDIKLETPHIDITEFFPKEERLTAQQQSDKNVGTHEVEEYVSGVMPVPKDMDMAFQIRIDTLEYNKLFITALSGVLGIKDQGLFLKNSDLKMVDGTTHLEGFYRPVDRQKALFSMDLKAEHLNIKKGYETIELFKELVPAAEHASGHVSLNYKLSGTLDGQMSPILPSLEGKGTLKAQNVQFEGYKLLGTVSEKSGFSKLNDPSVSEITINSSISNNVLTLEKFKFKVRPFRLKTEGQTTLDGELSLKIRIGLPPFGIIGIPIVIKGPSDDFDIKLGKKSPDLTALESDEGDYSEQDLQRMTMLKDSIREGMTMDEIDKMQRKIEKMDLDSLRVQSVDSVKVQ